MKNIFPGYNKKSESEIQNLWDKGVIMFDANVLLNLYRYSNETRKTIIELIAKFGNKIWFGCHIKQLWNIIEIDMK